MELLRRIIYYGCCFVAITGGFYTDLSPLVVIDIFEPDKDSRSKARRYTESLLSEEEQQAITQKRQAEIIRNTLTVNNSEWTEIYGQLKALKEGKSISENYKERLPSDQHPMSVFFFRINEPPIREIANYLREDNQTLYLRVVRNAVTQNSNMKNDVKYLQIDYRIYSKDDFELGSGLSRYPRPPTWMLYPYRQLSIYLFLFGLACYIFLPVKKISPNVIRYPRWRVMVGDFGVTLLTFVFFRYAFFNYWQFSTNYQSVVFILNGILDG